MFKSKSIEKITTNQFKKTKVPLKSIFFKICLDIFFEKPIGLVWFGLVFFTSLEPNQTAIYGKNLSTLYIGYLLKQIDVI